MPANPPLPLPPGAELPLATPLASLGRRVVDRLEGDSLACPNRVDAMILAPLQHADRYRGLHPLFAPAFDYLAQSGLVRIADGAYDLAGDRLRAIVSRIEGRGREASPLEFHRRYIDIQYVVAGVDVIGWLPTRACQRPKSPYDATTDLGFFYDRPDTWLSVPEGSFAVFFPDDAHAPLATAGPIHKVVMKLAIRG